MSIAVPLTNWSPFAAKTLVLPDQDGQEVLLVIVSATFTIGIDGTVVCADAQQPIVLADVARGVPGQSSLLREADVALAKPKVDILVIGSAYAPKGQAAERVQVGLAIGDVQKVLLVSGDREWQPGIRGRRASAPRPFESIPIIYERSFGGVALDPRDPGRSAVDIRNPIGVGFRGARSADSTVHTELPNIEYPRQLVTGPTDDSKPAGFGPVGRGWAPRARWAGTYDDRWLKSRWPLLPEDFDSRYNQSAPDDQQSQTVQGGEVFRTVNLRPEGTWSFRLPSLSVPVRHYHDDRVVASDLRVDTIVLEANERTLVMVGRVAARTVRNAARLREIVLGHPTEGWVRARAARKQFVGYRGAHPSRAAMHYRL